MEETPGNEEKQPPAHHPQHCVQHGPNQPKGLATCWFAHKLEAIEASCVILQKQIEVPRPNTQDWPMTDLTLMFDEEPLLASTCQQQKQKKYLARL